MFLQGDDSKRLNSYDANIRKM